MRDHDPALEAMSGVVLPFTVEELGGACPTQGEGETSDGRRWYFRARHGTWTLYVSDPGGEPPYISGHVLAQDEDETHGWMEPHEVMPLLIAHLTPERLATLDALDPEDDDA